MAEKIITATGAPGSTGTVVIGSAFTVGVGKTWTLKHVLVRAQCINTGVTPEGGEFTPYVESDVSGSYAGIVETSLETGNRYASQGSGPLSHVLTAGQHLRFSYFLRGGKTPADYEYLITVIYDES